MLREMPHKTRTKLVNLNLMTLAGLTSYQQITGTTFIWFHQMTNPLLVYFMILLSHFCRFCYVERNFLRGGSTEVPENQP